MSVKALIKTIKELPEVSQRKVAAIIGSSVVDAASRPLHWIYNQQTLDSILGDTTNTEFWPENKSPFYVIPLGERSCYNEECLATLMAFNEKQFDLKHICNKFVNNFGAGTGYSEAFARRKTRYDENNRNQFVGPVEGPWRHVAVTSFIERYQNNPNKILYNDKNTDMDGLCAALPIIVRYAGESDMWQKSKEVCSLFTMHEETLLFSHSQALLLQAFIKGSSEPFDDTKNAVDPFVLNHILEVEETIDKPFVASVAKFGKACSLPGSFKGAYLCMLLTSSFVDATRLNISAGGCTCSRGNFIGACLGARCGIDGIPIEWLEKVSNITDIMQMSINLMK